MSFLYDLELKGSGAIQPSSCLSGPEEKVTNAVKFTAPATQGESDEKSTSIQPLSLGQSRRGRELRSRPGQSCHGKKLRSRAKKQSSNVPFRDVAQRLTSNKTKSKTRQVVGDETFIISSNEDVVHTEKPATSPQTDVPRRQESVAMAEGENGDEIHDVLYFSASASQGKSDEKSPSPGQSCHGKKLRSRAKKQSSNVPFRDVAQKLTSNKTKSKARQVVGDETFIISSNVEVVHTEKPATSPQTDVPRRQESVAMADGENGDENHDVLYFRSLLEKEVDRLERICAKWSSVQHSTCLPQEVSSLINAALGQTGLLINQKLSQFRKLIYKCEFKRGRLPIFLSDLEGFWDSICLQVKNIDNRFLHLEKLEVNNWQESSPEVKSFIKKKKFPIPIKPEYNAKHNVKHNVKTSVRDFIDGEGGNTGVNRKQEVACLEFGRRGKGYYTAGGETNSWEPHDSCTFYKNACNETFREG
ncbi:unnamed protein product [Timema podura]|uniref:Disks large-associated protein 5 n=1 Tax=Timema podura TaxID=61482 RepID=A0ABN7ND25_TIMPD|nr:unnamed protein product [Timema podura]